MQKAMPEYKYNPDLEPFDQEIHLLEYFEQNFSTNPKKMLKLARKLRDQHPPFIQRSFFDTLEQTRDPIKWLRRCFVEMRHYPVIMEQLMNEGNHGMIMERDKIYGFALDTNKNWTRKSDRWSEEQERQIIDEALLLWMCVERRRAFIGRIVLFRDFGFSGISYEVDQNFSDVHWAKLQKIWEKEDAEKLTADLKKYLSLAEEEKNDQVA